MSNLIPEQRPDKNGKVTTRWVKPGQPPTKNSALPPVVLPKDHDVVDRASLLRSTTDIILANFTSADIDVLGTVKALERCSEDTLAVIKAELDKEGAADRIQTTAFWIDIYDHNQRLLREVLTYWDAFGPSTDYNFVDDSISQLHRLKSLPQLEDYSKADPETKKIITNVLSTTESLFAGDGDAIDFDGEPHILPEPLCRLVMRRPEDFDRINDIILDHEISDATQIEMMLDADNQSLRDGIL